MKNFLKLSLFLVIIMSFICITVLTPVTQIMGLSNNGVNKDYTLTKNMTEKSKETKINYSNTIHVLVTPTQKQEVNKKLKKLDKEVKMLAKVIYREARGQTKTHRAAVVWCVLNRVDSSKYANSIKKVIKSPNQFAWKYNTPVKKKHYNLAKDVVTRWLLEKEGIKEVGRVLPNNYFFFTGDGKYNYFRKNFNSTTYWNWRLKSPY